MNSETLFSDSFSTTISHGLSQGEPRLPRRETVVHNLNKRQTVCESYRRHFDLPNSQAQWLRLCNDSTVLNRNVHTHMCLTACYINCKRYSLLSMGTSSSVSNRCKYSVSIYCNNIQPMIIHNIEAGAIKRIGLPEPWGHQGYSNEKEA